MKNKKNLILASIFLYSVTAVFPLMGDYLTPQNSYSGSTANSNSNINPYNNTYNSTNNSATQSQSQTTQGQRYPNYTQPTQTYVNTPTTSTTYSESQGNVIIPSRRSSYTPTTPSYYNNTQQTSPFNLNSNYINDTAPASGDAPHFPNGSNGAVNRYYNSSSINQFYN